MSRSGDEVTLSRKADVQIPLATTTELACKSPSEVFTLIAL
jgi:hypothetical protein